MRSHFSIVLLSAFFFSSAAATTTAEPELSLLDRLNEVFDEIERSTPNPLNDQLKKVDGWCLRRRLDIPRNGHKLIPRPRAMFTIFGNAAVCAETRAEVVKVLIEQFMENIEDDLADQGECFRLELHQVEPNASILEGFDAASVGHTVQECERMTRMYENLRIIEDTEKVYGRIEELSCGNITKEDSVSFLLKISILKFWKASREVFKRELKIVSDTLSQKGESMADCLVRSLSKY